MYHDWIGRISFGLLPAFIHTLWTKLVCLHSHAQCRLNPAKLCMQCLSCKWYCAGSNKLCIAGGPLAVALHNPSRVSQPHTAHLHGRGCIHCISRDTSRQSCGGAREQYCRFWREDWAAQGKRSSYPCMDVTYFTAWGHNDSHSCDAWCDMARLFVSSPFVKALSVHLV